MINTQLTAVVFPKEIHFCDNHDGQFSSISQQDDQRDIAPPKVNTKNKIDIIVKKMCPCPLLWLIIFYNRHKREAGRCPQKDENIFKSVSFNSCNHRYTCISCLSTNCNNNTFVFTFISLKRFPVQRNEFNNTWTAEKTFNRQIRILFQIFSTRFLY